MPVTYEEALADGGDVQTMMYDVMVQGLTVAQRVSEPKYFMVSWKVFVFFLTDVNSSLKIFFFTEFNSSFKL